MVVKYSTYFLPQCPLFHSERCTLMSNLNKIDPPTSKFTLLNFTKAPLLGNSSFSNIINTLILNPTLDDILSAERLDELLF